jgi:fatty acid desaturase
MTYLITLAFVAIFASLATALYFMMRGNRTGKNDGKGGGMARALTVRISVSVALFACILLAWKLGYIHPTGIPVGK